MILCNLLSSPSEMAPERYTTLQDVTLRCKMLHYVVRRYTLRCKMLHYVVRRYTTL